CAPGHVPLAAPIDAHQPLGCDVDLDAGRGRLGPVRPLPLLAPAEGPLRTAAVGAGGRAGDRRAADRLGWYAARRAGAAGGRDRRAAVERRLGEPSWVLCRGRRGPARPLPP